MTVRDFMRENDENLGWCAAYRLLDGRIYAAVNGGNICGLIIDGVDVVCTEENIRRAAMMVNDCYADYKGWDKTHFLLEAVEKELPCRMCPWFGVCDAMDEYIDDAMDYAMDEDICDD